MDITAIAKTNFVHRGHVYHAGDILSNIRLDAAIAELERNKDIEKIDYYELESENNNTVRLIYLGRKDLTFIPVTDAEISGMQTVPGRRLLAYRCVPVTTDRKSAENILAVDPDYKILDTNAIYIGSNFTVASFEKDILPHLPKFPRVLIMRDNGAGDILMSIPAVKKLREILPYAPITYATLPRNMELLDGILEIDFVEDIHKIDITNNNYDLIINWARAVENYSHWRNREHRINSFSLHLGLGIIENEKQKTILNLYDCHRNAVQKLIVKNDPDYYTRRYALYIGYVLRAASWNRTYFPGNIPQISKLLQERLPLYKLILIDNSEYNFTAPNVINLCGQTETFKEAAAVLEWCNAVIAPDSGLAHAAGALEIPTVILNAGIPPEARYSTYENCKCLTAGSENYPDKFPAEKICYPCWDWQERFPNGLYKTCMHTKENHCMNHKPETIVNAVIEILKINSENKNDIQENEQFKSHSRNILEGAIV